MSHFVPLISTDSDTKNASSFTIDHLLESSASEDELKDEDDDDLKKTAAEFYFHLGEVCSKLKWFDLALSSFKQALIYDDFLWLAYGCGITAAAHLCLYQEMKTLYRKLCLRAANEASLSASSSLPKYADETIPSLGLICSAFLPYDALCVPFLSSVINFSESYPEFQFIRSDFILRIY